VKSANEKYLGNWGTEFDAQFSLFNRTRLRLHFLIIEINMPNCLRDYGATDSSWCLIAVLGFSVEKHG
jgi:hypothetical protein